MNNQQYYRQVIRVTEGFLGPAAERFVNRQIEFRLGKTPETITPSDMPQLKKALIAALGILVKDKEIVAQATSKFDAIIEE